MKGRKRNIRTWVNKSEHQALKVMRGKDTDRRILVIGDLHEPFCLDGYLEFCKETYRRYDCNQVVFIGDVIDNHYSSFHDPDPDGMGGGDELDLAIKKLSRWYEAFPVASVCIGNHDRIVTRKAFSSGVPKRWIKSMAEVLETPRWDYQARFVFDGTQYIHGESGRASKKAKDDMMSTVQGHRHTEMFTEFVVGAKFKVFGCAVGCGIDNTSYAMAYGKHFKKPAIGCAVVFRGEYAINIPMDL